MSMLFIETDSPPPFYQSQLTDRQRLQLDQWFIGHRSQAYYLKRFAEFDTQGYLSPKWHWAAFFMTFPWLLYRKRYLDAIVYSVAGWSFIHLNITIILVVFEYMAMGFVPEMYQMLVRVGIAAAIWLFWSVMVARWADAYYYRMARREIADAINDYPKEREKQKTHLQREGGVSWVGMGLGFGFFAFVLLVINVQFMPIFAKQQESEVLYEVYATTKNTQNRVAVIYDATGSCPVDMPVGREHEQVRLEVTTNVPGVRNTECAVTATIQEVGFPTRYLNEETVSFYRLPNGSWRCISSLNDKQAPKQCG